MLLALLFGRFEPIEGKVAMFMTSLWASAWLPCYRHV